MRNIKRGIMKLFVTAILFVSLFSTINASGYWVNSTYYFQHNPVTKNAKNNKVQNMYRTSKLKNNAAWNSAFMDGYNSYESKDSSGNYTRSFNLNVVSTNNTNISNADIYLVDDKANPKRLGIAIPCKINNEGKHSCSTNYVNNATVNYYKLSINRYAHDTIFSNVTIRKKEARLTSAHEFGHTLGMGHYTYKNQYVAKSKNSIMSYADTSVMNHALKSHDISRLRNIYGK
ncbi:hypothetical protein OKW22_001402 [Bacilli bacterium PM5-3]|nr:hypothetical protein [Bacilli bacterium PM5-3]MDH6604291.1 hypothetical protein [Bacilli bacterium PM5-9]